MRTEIIRFVRWEKLDAYLLLGWLPSGHASIHSDQFGCLCVWRCGCRCVEPVK